MPADMTDDPPGYICTCEECPQWCPPGDAMPCPDCEPYDPDRHGPLAPDPDASTAPLEPLRPEAIADALRAARVQLTPAGVAAAVQFEEVKVWSELAQEGARVFACNTCGVLVPHGRLATHRDWHRRLAQLERDAGRAKLEMMRFG